MLIKSNRLLLILCAIFLSVIVLVGCSNVEDGYTVKANYVETYFYEDANNGQLNMLDNYSALVTFLGNDTPNKYNDSFFERNSLLIFRVVESSDGNRSKIKSYTIIDKELNVYIETEIYGDTCAEGHWWFILELSKTEVNNIENVKIFKNNDEIIKNTIIKAK